MQNDGPGGDEAQCRYLPSREDESRREARCLFHHSSSKKRDQKHACGGETGQTIAHFHPSEQREHILRESGVVIYPLSHPFPFRKWEPSAKRLAVTFPPTFSRTCQETRGCSDLPFHHLCMPGCACPDPPFLQTQVHSGEKEGKLPESLFRWKRTKKRPVPPLPHEFACGMGGTQCLLPSGCIRGIQCPLSRVYGEGYSISRAQCVSRRAGCPVLLDV